MEHRMTHFRRIPFLLTGLLAFTLVLSAAPTSAAVVFSNASGAAEAFPMTIDGLITTGQAVGFTVPAGTDYQFNSITVPLARILGFLPASGTASLYTDNSGVPGSSIVSFGSASPGSTSFTNAVFNSPGNVTLSGGTNYWLVFTGYNLKMRRTMGAFSGVFTLLGYKNRVGTWQNDFLGGSYTVSLDATPLVTVSSISRASANPTGAPSVDWTVTFSGSISGLTSANFALAQTGVSGASITNVSGSGASWTVTASTGSGDGTLGLNMTSGGPTNLPFTGDVYTIDKTQTGTVISSTATDPTNISPIPMTVTFSEDVTGFEASDVVVSNGAVSNFAGSGSVYTFDVTPGAPGVVTVNVPAGVALDGANNGNEAAAQFSINYASVGLRVIRITLMNDGTDATATIPNPSPGHTPAYTIITGGGAGVHVDPSGAFVYPFDEGAPLGLYSVTVEVTSGGQSFNQLIEIEMLPAPPPVPLCEDHNFDEGGVVRSSTSDALGYAINCRVMMQNGGSTTWLGSDMYNAGSIGNQGVIDLGVQQAIDIYSPVGMTYFEGGAVFCLRGQGTLIWMPASQSPRVPQIIGSYTVPDFPGFTCATLFEPGTLVLVSQNPLD
jgi:hypothetical protein